MWQNTPFSIFEVEILWEQQQPPTSVSTIFKNAGIATFFSSHKWYLLAFTTASLALLQKKMTRCEQPPPLFEHYYKLLQTFLPHQYAAMKKSHSKWLLYWKWTNNPCMSSFCFAINQTAIWHSPHCTGDKTFPMHHPWWRAKALTESRRRAFTEARTRAFTEASARAFTEEANARAFTEEPSARKQSVVRKRRLPSLHPLLLQAC